MENIQKIIYINLDHRTDRKKEIEDEFERLSIPKEKIIRFSAVSHPDPVVSCALSHAHSLKLAHSLNLDNVLILEDDFNFIDDIDKVNFNLNYFFSNIKDYDALLFIKCFGNSTKMDDILSICNDSSNAAGYLVNKNMFATLAEDFEKSAYLLYHTKAHWIYANDQVWKKYQKNGKWFCFNEHIGYQRRSYSDLSKCEVFYQY
jgi:glycosyl transferase, family 25